VAILRRKCDDNALILGRQRILVPNAFVIELPPTTHQQLTAGAAFVDHHLALQVHRHAAEQGYTFAGPVTVHLRPCHSSTVGRFRIHSRIAPLTIRHSSR
jgi:hypothetical protein